MSNNTNEHRRKQSMLLRRKARIRSTVRGTSARPRMSVRISNAHVSAQLIDDQAGHTLLAVSSVGQKTDGNLTDKAVFVGEAIAKKAAQAKVKQVVLDRNGRQYHGRIKALAEAARKQGLEF